MRCLTESRHDAISDIYGDRSCDSMITRLNGELSITFLAIYFSTFRFDDERYRHLARNMPKINIISMLAWVLANSPLSHGGHIVLRETKKALFYHAKPHPHGFHREA